MGKLISIDYGIKRTGIAETDTLKIIASPRETVDSYKLKDYLKLICTKEDIEAIILGLPTHLDGNESEMSKKVLELKEWIEKELGKSVFLVDERFSSKMALDSMITMGTKKKDRKNKGNIDKISAAIILQDFLNKA
jgi:putative Holliday junction resolvase